MLRVDLVTLQEFRAQDCFNLVELPDLRQLTSLRVLNLKKASYYQEYQMKRPEETHIKGEPDLQVLRISYSGGVEPTGVSSLRSLTRLKLYRCDFEDVSCLSSSPALQHLHVKSHGPSQNSRDSPIPHENCHGSFSETHTPTHCHVPSDRQKHRMRNT
jgi:hypothetical protein